MSGPIKFKLHDTSPEAAHATSLEMEKALSALSAQKQNFIINELWHGSLKTTNPDVKDNRLLFLLAGLRPDQQHRLATAYRGTGHFPDGIRDKIKARQSLLGEIQDRHDEMSAMKQGIEDDGKIVAEIERMAGSLALNRLSETCWHKVIEAINSDTLRHSFDISDERQQMGRALLGALRAGETGVYIVNHNWAAAFDKAKDFDGGEIRMPNEVSIFEFRVSGNRTCLTVCADEDGLPDIASLFIEMPAGLGWVLCCAYKCLGGSLFGEIHADRGDDHGVVSTASDKIFKTLTTQVRAILIALEAEVAESELVRAPHKLNVARAKKGKLPIFDYHAIHLTKRKRYEPRDLEPGETDHEVTHRRMHFVRGHWRHYPDHKTFVKWHLRGNPDLGFIDKEYRL